MARTLIVGCGYVGSVLAAELVAVGQTVFGLRRSDAALPEGVTPLRADVSKPLSPKDLPGELDAVVYAVAAKSRDEAVYRAAYVDGLGHLIDAILASGSKPGRLVFTSSTAVYGQHGGEWVDEGSPTHPPTFSGRILLEAESKLARAPFETASLRLGGIYGPGRTSRLRAVADGQVRVREGAPHYTNRIHLDDAAGAIKHLLHVPTLPPIVLGVDDEPADERAVALWMAEALGVAAPKIVGAADAYDATPKRGGSKRCRNTQLHSLGYSLRHPTFREGYSGLLHEVLGDAAERPGA